MRNIFSRGHPYLKSAVFLAALFAFVYLLFWCIGRFLLLMPEPIGSRAELFTLGAKMTLGLTLSAGVIGIGVGIFLGLAKLSRLYVVKWPAAFFVWIMRGTPLLVQILFVYYALPAVAPFLKFNEFTAAMIALALNVGAYNAEAIRAGILAVPKGQTEAARSLGLSRLKTLRWVVLPQAIRIVVPPLMNNVVALLKDSSLASSIGLLELTLSGNRITSETFRPVPVLITVAAVYLVLTTALTAVTYGLEKGKKYYEARAS
jgi:polar amino acid transport system permease protein